MGNCHKNRICEFLNNHCPQLFLDCFQSIFPRDDDTQQDNNNNNDKNNQQADQEEKLETLPGQQRHTRQTIITTNDPTNDSNQSITSSSLYHNCGGSQHQQQQSLTQSVHYCHHLSHCQYNITGGTTSNLLIQQSARLKLDLKTRLETMQRQRSASHCPHTTMIAGIDQNDSIHKCCCQKNQSSNIVVDPLVKMVSSPTSISGRQKRASSLRVLNKRFNFFDNSTNLPNDGSNNGGGSRRGSRKNKRQTTKINDLDDQCFLAIFEYLTLQEKLYYERVCRRWQRLIRRSLQVPASLKIGEHSVKCNCQCAHFPSWDLPPSKRFSRDQSGYIIYPKQIIRYLLTLCSQLHCINFSHCYLDDQTLQIIMDHSDMIECLHLNDIRLEEDFDELPNGLVEKTNKHIMDDLSNGHQDETISSAVGAFASEQLAVFGGLMRKLSTRRSMKKTNNNDGDGIKRHSDASMVSKQSTGSSSNWRRGTDTTTSSSNYKMEKFKKPVNQTKSTPSSSSITNQTVRRTTTEMSSLLSSNINRTTPNLSTTSTPNHNVQELQKSYYNHCLPNEDMRASLENIVRKTMTNFSNQPQQQSQSKMSTSLPPPPPVIFHQQQSNTNKAATQRRHEWLKHLSSNNKSILMSDEQLSINVINETMNSDSVLTLNDDASSIATSSIAATNTGYSSRRHLSPNIAPNISSLQTDSDGGMRFTSHSQSGSSGNSSNSMMTSNQIAESEMNSHHSSNQQYQPIVEQNLDNLNKMDHVQAYVEQEQIRHELRQNHLLQWKAFAKKLGSQIRCLSLGSLSSVDSIVIDILLKYSCILEELRINNEIDILSYLSIIKHTIKRIYINCEHGIGLECVSLLAYRNYAEKVIALGRVDVSPDLIDSVISTIGSNFCNLRSLYLRLHNFDIEVATPANLLFDNLNELNLQFVSGNVDQPFKKFIKLGWSSVRSLTIQYASITEESARAIHEHMPQLRKLVLYAIEFRCDHLARRYGHRICTNCSHTVWKCIATLPHLNHLKLHRVIIDEEICKALSRMHRLTNLDLQYCSNVNDNVINVCGELARRYPRRRFTLCIISRGFITFKKPANCNNLYIDVKVTCK